MILGRKIWFWGEKNEFPGQKKDFYDDLGVKISKKKWKFEKMLESENFGTKKIVFSPGFSWW